MRVGIDATPLVGKLTGIGRYVDRVYREIAELPDPPEQILTLFSLPKPLPELPAHCERARLALPARLVHPLWRRFRQPPAELLTGPIELFHGGNFVVPPTRKAKRVMTIHDLTFRYFPHTLHPAAAKALSDLPQRAREVDAVITVSEAVADEIVADVGVPRERITVAPNGVGLGWFAATALTSQRRDELSLPADYFVFLGTLEPRKNLPVLLRAYRLARASQPDLPDLVLIGASGWGEQPQLAGDHTGIHALGYLDDDDVRSVVAGARALLSPSSYEGFGLPVLEGLAAGTQVIASDIAAHREVAGGYAQLIAPDDLDGWVHALLTTGCSTAESQAAGRRHAAAFTWRRSAELHLELYRSLTGR